MLGLKNYVAGIKFGGCKTLKKNLKIKLNWKISLLEILFTRSTPVVHSEQICHLNPCRA